MENDTSVRRIRTGGKAVVWPSMRQMNKRGCTPYFELAIGGSVYRVHFFPTSEMREARPFVVHTIHDSNAIKVSMSAEDKNYVFGKQYFVREAS